MSKDYSFFKISYSMSNNGTVVVGAIAVVALILTLVVYLDSNNENVPK